MALFQNANYDFIKWRWHAIALSAVIIIAGFAYAATRGVPLGIDFSGGTVMVVQFEQPVSDDEWKVRVRSAALKTPQPELHLRAEKTTQYQKLAEIMAELTHLDDLEAMHEANMASLQRLKEAYDALLRADQASWLAAPFRVPRPEDGPAES